MFGKRVKTCGKSDTIQYINKVYKIKSDTVYILPLREQFKGQKKATRVIPVQCVTKQNRHLIDDQAVLSTFKSQIKKFFNKETESKTKVKRTELLELIDDDQVMIRLETVRDKQYDQVLIKPSEL